MNLFEALYGRICSTPISWSDPVTNVLIGMEILEEKE